tara:strand:+ start:806 stop:1297 length:492 start_codon:yes stop_codon:yes gene_type:complete
VIYEDLSISELAKLISPSSEAFLELKRRGVLRTKNIVGELGEYYAIEHYTKNSKLPSLSIAPVTVKNIDALSRNGEIYSIKTVSSRNGTTGSFWDPESIEKNEKKFDYLLIVIIDQSYALDMILELSWEDFFKYKRFNKRMNNYNISLTNTLINEVNIVYERR